MRQLNKREKTQLRQREKLKLISHTHATTPYTEYMLIFVYIQVILSHRESAIYDGVNMYIIVHGQGYRAGVLCRRLAPYYKPE